MLNALVPFDQENIKKYIGQPNNTSQKPLRRLRPKHLRIIALHMQGYTGPQTKAFLEESNVTISLMAIYRVINDPLSKGLMAEFYAGAENELKALDGMAIDVLRRAMRDGSHRDAISAADKIFKMNKRYGDPPSSDSAESIIQRAMDVALQAGETVREVIRERPRMTDITPGKTIEGTAT